MPLLPPPLSQLKWRRLVQALPVPGPPPAFKRQQLSGSLMSTAKLGVHVYCVPWEGPHSLLRLPAPCVTERSPVSHTECSVHSRFISTEHRFAVAWAQGVLEIHSLIGRFMSLSATVISYGALWFSRSFVWWLCILLLYDCLFRMLVLKRIYIYISSDDAAIKLFQCCFKEWDFILFFCCLLWWINSASVCK